MKVYDCYNLNKKSGMFGIEIEVEGENLPNAISQYWLTTKDNSLRGEAFEYVLKTPYSLSTVKKALNLLSNEFAAHGARPNFSHRTSVHVHVNVQMLTRDQLINFLYLSYMFDSVLAKIGGREITGNRFALRIRDAENQVFHFKNMVSDLNRIKVPRLDEAKYSAVNIVPIANYGSVEFRSMRGTVDPVELYDWVSLIYAIYQYALTFNTIDEMMAGFLRDERAWVNEIFPINVVDHVLGVPDFVDDLRINYSLLQPINYSVKYNHEQVEKIVGKDKYYGAIMDDVVDDRVARIAHKIKLDRVEGNAPLVDALRNVNVINAVQFNPVDFHDFHNGAA